MHSSATGCPRFPRNPRLYAAKLFYLAPIARLMFALIGSEHQRKKVTSHDATFNLHCKTHKVAACVGINLYPVIKQLLSTYSSFFYRSLYERCVCFATTWLQKKKRKEIVRDIKISMTGMAMDGPFCE